MDEQPYDPEAGQVAAAAAQLELARRSREVGSISLAHLNLGATLAALGDHRTAVTEYEALLQYLQLASGDEERDVQRRLRMLSPSAPPPGAQDIDLATVQTVTRISLAESLLALGRRDEARAELDRATPGTRGFGRGTLRKRLTAVRRRMDSAAQVPADTRTGRGGAPAHERVELSLAEQVAAADELLAAGNFSDSARVSLGIIGSCGDDDRLVRAQARQVLGMALDAMGQHDDSRSVLRDSYTDYLAVEDSSSAANVATALAWRMSDAGDQSAAVDLLSGALEALRGRVATSTEIQLLVDLGSLQDQDDRPDQARISLEAAVGRAAAVDDPLVAADAGHGLAIVLANRTSDPDDAVEALSILAECRRGYASAGHPDRAVGCDHEAAALLGRLGSWDAAAARYQRALDGYRELPEPMRDTGSWPDEVADCELNLAALDADRGALAGDPRLFRSGGHTMSHEPPVTPP